MPTNTNVITSRKPACALPEFFAYYIRDFHNIDLNAKPKNIRAAWIKFLYTRDHTFNQINHWYQKVSKKLEDSQSSLHWEHEQLYSRWGINFSIPFELSDMHSNDWSKPASAVPTLKKVYEQIPSREKIRELSKGIDKTERDAWVNELMAMAKEKNATFVVMKTQYAPYPENMEKFEEAVRNRHSCSIRMMCIGLEWLACSVDDLPGMLLEDLGKDGLNRKNCTVEFIVS